MIKDEEINAIRATKNIDYVALKWRNGDLSLSVYYNDCKKNDFSATEYLSTVPQWKFLVDDKLILFHTSQIAANVNLCYEYKLSNLSIENENFEKMTEPWGDSRSLIKYFSSADTRGEFKTGGIFFFGCEFPFGRKKILNEAILKIYFKTYFSNSSGDRLFDDGFFLEKINKSGQKQLIQLSDYVKSLLPFGFNVYMVSWNSDKLTGEITYKIYLLNTGNQNIDGLYNKMVEFDFCDGQSVESIRTLTKRENLVLRGLTVGLIGEKKRSNFYYVNGK